MDQASQTKVEEGIKLDPSINQVALSLMFAGWCIIIIALIWGGFAGYVVDHFVTQIALPIWIGGILSGLFLIGLSEIIKLLHSIDRKMVEKTGNDDH